MTYGKAISILERETQGTVEAPVMLEAIDKVLSMARIISVNKNVLMNAVRFLRNHVNDLLKELLKEREWISVKDRLPEVDTNVLAYARGKNDPIYKIIITSMGNLFDVDIKTKPYWREPWQHFDTMYEITHWMPLHEPPKEEKDDDE